MGEISITKLLVVAALVVLLFGTKKLRTLGGDLGTAIKGFKKAMNDDDSSAKKTADDEVPAEKLSHKE
ncbi:MULTISPECIES: twin-arginine translocase subunit TatE [Lelliottia]|uniref:Probable Sec-independent protein translocase protein TatE n=2 Tax=Lelliottia TaxID=1330545 RepID=A0ABX5A2C3_9ENTR|nr:MULTISPECIES: twin-arginine translocase subunit TatE [Lelliottia]ASV54576.1 Twin-arginine translocation protein TatE [Lelliottia jeotgali]MBL5884301.1 twin-arginine translocase subunit TatE [Lelliottia aquatilis]MDI3361245.1 twin-arginine translocase subunit TatE [Lelliottia sp. V89_13]MDK9358676.1 twin-arginine translocase subunit TatE [Lelliottia sp. V106_16]MDK9364949.1 twin-arginine translocase subunit TatE [Lelliottia sp. V106_12]